MSILFGMPTLIECPEIADSINLCASLGLGFVELNMNLPVCQLDTMNVEAIKTQLADNGLFCTIHLDENLNVCDFNAAVADAYQKTVLDTIAVAKKLAAPVLTMHMASGVYFTLPDRKIYLFEQYRDLYLEKLSRFRALCDAAIGDSDITICIENGGAYKGFQQAGIDVLLQSAHFGLTYDIGHAYSGGLADEPFVLARQNKLCHMHIHDAHDGKDHLPLGTGDIDLLRYLTLAEKNDCRCVIETKTVAGLTQSVAWLKHINAFV